MRITVQTDSILNRYGIDRGFGMIAEAGFDGVDFSLYDYLPGSQIRQYECRGFFDRSDEEILEEMRPYKEGAAKYGLCFVQAHAPFPNYVADDATNEYVRKAAMKTIMICGYVGCGNLVVHPGYRDADERMTLQEEWDYNINMYKSFIPALREYHVVCCLENMFSRHRGKLVESIFADPNEACRYVDTLNDIAGERLFGFCLDTGHANVVGKDLYRVIHQLGDRIQILHIHDNDGTKDEHIFPYMGIIDWERFCRALGEINYAHDLSFETGQAMDIFAPELAPQLLDLLYATGVLFRNKIDAARRS